jgi:hypothetical protein
MYLAYCNTCYMDYDLARLGPHEFEHLVQALCFAAFGAKVEAFGTGPDGGRDATIEGRIDWGDGGEWGQLERWDGYTVVQAKFRARPSDPDSNLRWLLRELRKELSGWSTRRRDEAANLHSETDRRLRLADSLLAEANQQHKDDLQPEKAERLKLEAHRLRNEARHMQQSMQKVSPDYLLIVTNVVLSPGRGAGIETAHMRIAKMVNEFKLGFRSWRLWHYDTVRSLLDVHPSVRITYGGFLNSGDVLARMDEWLGHEQTKLGDALTMHAAKDLLAQQYVRLGQAGDRNEDKLALHEIGIDLPAQIRTEGRKLREINAARHIIEQGEHILDNAAQENPPHLLMIGGPGQGKSTLSQLVCQCYRVALLREASLSREAQRLLDRLATHFDQIGLAAPKHLRWPIRIVLSDYGDYVAANSDNSLLRYLAKKVSSVSPSDVTGADLQEWLGSWPWLLVLDGMDEVVSPIARDGVTQGISDFLVEATHTKADVLLVITTRPQGYLGEFGSRDYQQVLLRDLKTREALSYAHKLTAVRLGEDPDTRRKVDNRLSDATKAPETSRLMRTPLQVTIMTLLLEHRERVPSDRYQLFHAYFDTIYTREANKPTELGKFLEDYRADIEAIHETVALELQRQAELIAEHEGSLPAADLDKHAFDRLRFEGNDDEKARMLAQQIVRAATHRLVLLVPSGDNGVGFEIRSLQEYLAARALTRAEGPEVLENLRALVSSVHWRNTWLLAAGRLFTEREALRAQLITMLEQFDNENALSWLVRAGAQLASDLLDDDLAIRSPQYRRLLADQALGRLNGLPDTTSLDLGRLLIRLAAEDKLIRQKIDHQITTLLTTEGGSYANARIVLKCYAGYRNKLKDKFLDKHKRIASVNDYGLRALLDGPQAIENEFLERGPKLATYLNEHLAGLGPEDREAIMRLSAALPDTSLRINPGRSDPQTLSVLIRTPLAVSHTLLQEVFSHPDVAEAYAGLVNSLPPQHWNVASYLRDIARTWYARRVNG